MLKPSWNLERGYGVAYYHDPHLYRRVLPFLLSVVYPSNFAVSTRAHASALRLQPQWRMANCTDLLDLMPDASRMCPCLASLLKPQHANRGIESVALVGGLGHSPDPDTEPVPSAAAAAWFHKIQASVTSTVLGAPDELEPSWALLCKGATMRLDGPSGPDVAPSTALRNEPVALALTADHALLTWKTVRLAQSMPVASGAVAMSSVSVEAAARGWFSAPAETALLLVADGQVRGQCAPSALPVHSQCAPTSIPRHRRRRLACAAALSPALQLVTPDAVSPSQTLSLTAESVAQKGTWADALTAVAARASDDRHTRKLGHSTRRTLEMQVKKREAERRKAEVMGTCTSGMRHTARAMASR